VLITGATSGIGRATALHLAARGYRVFATGRTEKDLASLQEEVKGLPIETVVLDVTSPTSIEAARALVEGRVGALDVLINNAGFAVGGPTELVTDGDLRAQFEVNVFGLMAVTRAFLPAMRRRRAGRVVNLASLAGRHSFPMLGTYCASKHAVVALTDALRVELRPFRIAVVSIEPGTVRTAFIARAVAEGEKYRVPDSPYAAAVAHSAQLQSLSERSAVGPEAIVALVLKALTARWPKAHYRGPWFAALGVALLSALPTAVADALLSRLFRLHLLRAAGPPTALGVNAERAQLR
jgi:NAD(P)-dependent dehydrogenase (short-subunit alcohol dehydrogenase family)